ncbi:hypothetical protein L195_g005317 [Trifolium pratense]|uniref:Uncharacterized protein n=1 Tax=Trifolium pratense TaxID=57577 RepID=A0A2K3P0M1_TRIPR|nr:hypothetical protein L195_g005317 [Trifolium pratense]
MNMEDLFPEFAPISTSQEELLQRNRFEIENPFHEITSTYNHRTNIASSSTNPIISLSRPDFLVDIQGFVHAPSFVSLDNVDVANCSFNTADDETLDLIDFGNYSNLGFSENSTTRVEVEGDDRAQMDCDDDLGEPPHKKMKSLGMNGEDGVDSVNNYNDSHVEIPTRNDKGKKVSVFDASRFLANAKKIEDENKDHIATRNGVTLSHPSWRPKPQGH